jgi:diguanylate cyclase (GGDEF)-like protein
MPESTASDKGGLLTQRLASLLRRPFASLPSRIVISVMLASLVTSLVVTWVSSRSIGSFLRGEIDQKFPAMLLETSDRLEGWYTQREAELAIFGQSRVVQENFALLAAAPHGAAADRVRGEAATYLRYVLERFPQFETLFVLDAEGSSRLSVGRERELPTAMRSQLAAVSHLQVGHVWQVGDQRVQVVSWPIDDAGAGLSLHAIIHLESVATLLVADELGESGLIFVADPAGNVLLGTPGVPLHDRHERPLAQARAASEVARYTHSDGRLVVGSSRSFDRFGWTLVVEESYEEAFAPVVSVIQELLGINLGVVALFSLVAFWIARSTVRPIVALSDSAMRIATGDTGMVIPDSGRNDEIGVLTNAFNEMMTRLDRNQEELEEKRIEIEDANHRLIAQNQELQRVNEVFEQLSITDDLTKLHNNRFFQNHLPREMSRAKRTGEPLSLILIDIDDFKQLNDRYGHSVGDAVLRKVSDVMSREVRDMDLLARYGGEEFALLASQTTLEGAVALAEKLRIAVSEARFSLVALDGPTEIRVSVSSGVAPYRGDEKAFFNEADRALYRAKEAGKDCVCVCDERDGSSRTNET